jgi:hypothetical protein
MICWYGFGTKRSWRILSYHLEFAWGRLGKPFRASDRITGNQARLKLGTSRIHVMRFATVCARLFLSFRTFFQP